MLHKDVVLYARQLLVGALHHALDVEELKRLLIALSMAFQGFFLLQHGEDTLDCLFLVIFFALLLLVIVVWLLAVDVDRVC